MERTKPIPVMSPKRAAAWAAAGRRPSSTLAKLDAEGQVRGGVRRWPAKAAAKAKARKAARRSTGPDAAGVDAVIDRDGSCVVCGEIAGDERGMDWSIQHRKRRSQGGDNRLSNLILLCGNGTMGCHRDVDGDPANGRRGGWLLLSTDDPEQVPVAHRQLGYVLLDNEGGYVRTDRRPEVG